MEIVITQEVLVEQMELFRKKNNGTMRKIDILAKKNIDNYICI
jgi:hypothetical protein